MKKLLVVPFLLFLLPVVSACSHDDASGLGSEQPAITEGTGDKSDADNFVKPEEPSGSGKVLVAYFSAQGHTQAVAERIVALTGADTYRIEAAEPYASDPYDDSDRIQNEAYNNLRPGVANLPEEVTPNSKHVPATLPEDLDPDNIREPQDDDAGIDMPGSASGVEAWLRRLGVIK